MLKILPILFLFIFVTTSLAQKTWEKPFNKWTKDEAMKILSDSPWAQTYQSTEGVASASQQQIRREQGQTVNSGGGNPRSYERNQGPAPVVIRLHSALPIRQAIVQLRRIEAGYDKLDEKNRAEFDKSVQGFIDCKICQNYYVVTITKFINSSGQSVEEGIFQRANLEQLKGNVWLVSDKGVRHDLVQFNAPKNASDMAVFYFARQDDKGVPFLTAENQKFDFAFNNSFLDNRNPYSIFLPRRFEFSVSKLISNNNVVF